MNKLSTSLAAFAFLAIVAIFTAFGTYFTVAPYERVVVTRAGAFSYVAQPGLHFKLPFIDGTNAIRIDTQQFTTATLNTYTVDNQEVDATLTVQYRIPVEAIEFTFTNNQAYSGTLLAMVIDRWKIEAGKVNVSEIANNRGQLITAVGSIVKAEAMRLYHLEVLDVQLTNLEYLKTFRDAQAQAAVVKTQIEQSEGLKKKALIDAETAKIAAAGDANRQIEFARGAAEQVRINAIAQAEQVRVNALAQAEAVRVNAIAQAEMTRLYAIATAEAARVKGVADASVIKATGEAEAVAKEQMAHAISANPSLVEYLQASRWDGKLPQSIYAGAPIPFMSMSAK